MSKQTINVGSSVNSGTGDQLRDAMIKVNTNFDELYSSKTSSETTLNNLVDTTASMTSTLESLTSSTSTLTSSVNSLSNVISNSSGNLIVAGDIIPSSDLTFNLGSATNRWHSMYIGANTIYIGDNTVVSGSSIAITGDPNASSLSQMPTFFTSRMVAKPFSYTSNGGTVTVRPSIEFQTADGTSYPISFNTSTNEFSLDAAGDHGTGSLVAKKITLTNTGTNALIVNGNIMQTGNLRVDGNTTLGYDLNDTLTVKATTTFEGPVTVGNGSDTISINSGAGNFLNIISGNFNLSSTGAVIPGNLTVQGNLTIQGTQTSIDSNQVNIGDNIITLNSDIPAGNDPTENAGIQIARGTEAAVKWIWDETNDYWTPMGANVGNINTLAAITLNATTINGNASSATKLATARTIALSGDVTGSALFDGTGNISITTVAGTVDSATTAATATKLAIARTISVTGDATGSTSFDGSTNAAIALTLTDSGVTAGTYPKVTVDAKGRVTGGSVLLSSDLPVSPTVSGVLTITSAATNGIELGRQDGVASSPYIDFHSGATATDYDVRIKATGGNGTAGNGTLNYSASTHVFEGSVALGTAAGWTFVDNGGTLTIKYNGVTLFTLSNTGALTVKGDITAFGSI